MTAGIASGLRWLHAATLASFMLVSSHALADTAPVLRATLPNGLRVIIVRNTLAPVVATSVNYLVGSDEAPAGFSRHGARAGAHDVPRQPGTYAPISSPISAASWAASFNANTRESLTQYLFTVPAEDLDVALHIEATRMRGVLDSAKDWDQERGAIEQEVAQDLSNPGYMLYDKAACGHVRRHALCARRARHAAFVRQDHAREMLQAVPRRLVRAEQRHPDRRRRSRSAGDAGEGQAAVRRHHARRRCPPGAWFICAAARAARSGRYRSADRHADAGAARAGPATARIFRRSKCWPTCSAANASSSMGWCRRARRRRRLCARSAAAGGTRVRGGVVPAGRGSQGARGRGARDSQQSRAARRAAPSWCRRPSCRSGAQAELQKNSIEGLASVWSEAVALYGLQLSGRGSASASST